MEWIDVSVFISSTFNDMHAERDLLLKKVFPELSEWCARRHIRLFDIDLRWGVTDDDAKNRNTVEVCLRNVDRCRPFFLCFLGQRRGWVPDPEMDPPEINTDTFRCYPEVKDRFGKRSVTEMEIEHALLAPMRRIVDGRSVIPKASDHALFFIRDGAYLSELNNAQRQIFTNEDTEDEKRTDEQHASFIRQVREKWTEVYDYTCRFDRQLYSAELRDRGEECAQGRLTDLSVRGERMDAFILEALKDQILKAYPDRGEEISGDSGESESDRHMRRAEEVRQGAAAREDALYRLQELCTGQPSRPVYVYGTAGTGKSTLLSLFQKEMQQRFDHVWIRFCGASQFSSQWPLLWRELFSDAGLENNATDDFSRDIGVPLRRFPDDHRTLIIIDGVDELQEGLSVLASVPGQLPDHVRLILSFRREGEAAEALIRHLEADGASMYEVRPLEDPQEIERLASIYLRQYLKALNDEQIREICCLRAARTPLFLKVILRELRVFGAFSQMESQISGYGETPQSAFHKMLDDLNNEICYNAIAPDSFVPPLTGMLSLVRGGIRISILKNALSQLLGRTEEEVSDTLAYYFRRLGPYLITDGQRVCMAYQSLRDAAAELCRDDLLLFHRTLADAYGEEDPLECLYHWRMAAMPQKVRDLSRNIRFLCRAVSRADAAALLEELSLTEETDPDVLACLRQTAPVIGRNSRYAAPLFYKELSDPVLRQRAAEACEGSWLRCEPEETVFRPSESPKIFSAEFLSEHAGVQSIALAGKIKAAFLLTGESELCIDDLHGTRKSMYTLPVQGRVRKLVCSPDGSFIAAAGEGSALQLFRVTMDEELRILAVSCIVNDSYASVRFGGIALFPSPTGITWQRPDGTVVLFSEEAESLSEKGATEEKLTGCFGECSSWKTGRANVLTYRNFRIPAEARINDAVLHEDRIYLAAEDKTITVIDSGSGEITDRMDLPAESVLHLSFCDGILYGVDRYGSIVRVTGSAVEDLGRITQGDSFIDTDTQLMDMGEGELAFVSMQRSAILKTGGKHSDARIARAYAGTAGVHVLWDGEKEFTALLAGGMQYTVPFPDFILKGNNVNEKNNLRIACSDSRLAFEDIGKGLRILSSVGDHTLHDSGLSDMGGLLCDLQFVPEIRCFEAVSHRAQYLQIPEQGGDAVRTDLPRSESDLYLLCPCGNQTAILSRRVKIREDRAASAYFSDVLSMMENGHVLWTELLPRQDDLVKGMLYDPEMKRLLLFYSKEHMESRNVSDGRIAEDREFPSFGNDCGAAMVNNTVYYTSGKDRRLTAYRMHSGETVSLPSHRRIRQISGGPYGLIILEGDERIFRVFPETDQKTE